MTFLLRCLALGVWAFAPAVLAADETSAVAAVRLAEEQRIAAVLSGDLATLNDRLSADLRYALADGRVQTKSEYLASVKNSQAKYRSFKPSHLHFSQINDHAVAVDGQARFLVDANGQRVESTIRFLALWREENSHWRLLAYQSAQITPSRRN
jgi:hypothetical protein